MNHCGTTSCYWLDRMVRSRHQLVERLALVFHDWFATSNDAVGSARLMLDQTNVFRANGSAASRRMVRAITQDPAMILFLDLASNRKGAINENYARELMELFTLGADRGAYTRTTCASSRARSAAGTTTGASSSASTTSTGTRRPLGPGLQDRVRQDRALDVGGRRAHGRRAPQAPVVLRRQAVELLRPDAAGRRHAAKLEQLYVSSGYAIRPVLEAILCSPQLYTGPRMVKPPTVFVAGMLRGPAVDAGITDNSWSWVMTGTGPAPLHQLPAGRRRGWDDKRWAGHEHTTLGTCGWLARPPNAGSATTPWIPAGPRPTRSRRPEGHAVTRARTFLGRPQT
jgi:uncharacterized protein (DUF1800 family)